jgi:general secretion pathway protein G
MRKNRLTRVRADGFTLIELLVVLAVVAMLVSLAVPRYFSSLEKSRESVLRYDLSVMRTAIDRYYGDLGVYPDSLQDLVDRKYLKGIPRDPITEQTDSWIVEPPTDGGKGAVHDVHSGAPGQASDGTAYGQW